ncbi:MAG: cytidylate kinase family protein [Candidatus Aenigmarchaeota archaeon]|nr:cytidylate kinase family protein [Candidatus Aenigmarchaeota archaeon]
MKKLVVVVSSPPGSGGSTIAKVLAKKLKIKYFSPGEYFKKLSGKKGNETKAALSYLKTKEGASKTLHEHIDKLQIEKAEKGNIVLEGTLSIHFLKELSDCKIWIGASLEKRAERTSRRDGISVEDALKKVGERENMERHLFKKLYGFDYLDQKREADLVIDTSYLTVDQVVNKILKFIKEKGSNLRN